MKGLSLNSEGYIRINSQEWGDIIILRMDLFQDLMTKNEQLKERTIQEVEPKPKDESYFFTEEFGNWVYAKLKEKKLNQAVLAKQLQTTQATISRIVSCSSIVIPSLEIRLKVFKYLSTNDKN